MLRACFFLLLLVSCRPKTPETPTKSNPAPVTPAASLGLTKEEAVEVCKPPGEREYLERLRCSDGSAPTFKRKGSVGERNPSGGKLSLAEQMDANRVAPPGEADSHVVDLYEVDCNSKIVSVFMDMYHCSSTPPTTAPPGFTLVIPQPP